MPKPPTDRRLLTTIRRATDALKFDTAEVRQAVTRHGGQLWHVRILDFKDDPDHDDAPWVLQLAPLVNEGHRDPELQPYIAVDFLVGDRDGQLHIVKWSISGYEILTTTDSRFPLALLAKAALFAAEDALAADDLTYETIMAYLAQGLHYSGSLAEPGDWVRRDYRVVNGHIRDPQTGQPRPRPRRLHVTAKSAELRDRPALAVDEYRRALARGSRSPTADVAAALNVGRSTAARAIAEARRQGLLGPALRNRGGEQN